MGPLILTAPSTVNTDVSLKKTIMIRESKTVQLSADMFNAFNRSNLAPPTSATAFVNNGSTTSPNFVPNGTAGQITAMVGTSRQFQIGVRLQF